MKSTAVFGLRLSSSIAGDKEIWLNLPPVYTREDIPVDIEEVATRENIKSWDHLTLIAEKLPHSTDIEIGLLIGADCAKALEPQEVIPSKNGGPFAFRTTLGWCVVGPLAKPSKRNSISCHQLIVQDAISGTILSHHFGVSNKVKDISAKQMLTAIYNADFNEKKTGRLGHSLVNIEEVSFEGRKFLKMMDENSTKVGNHYQLPLLLKNKSIIFPDNRPSAEKSLHCLKKRFLRNPKFFDDYRKFIEVLLVKGYARKSTNEGTEGRTWYVLHHGVYHPNKAKKIIVVFDCSAEFNGVSLNKSLMRGQDLTNSIVVVITRFREESVVIIGDIEAMFHQVLVAEKYRNLLRFLWWEIATSTTV